MREFRASNELTQIQFAKLISLPQSSVFDIENGRDPPSLDTLARIAAVLQWTVEEIGEFVLNVTPTRYRYVDPSRSAQELRDLSASRALKSREHFDAGALEADRNSVHGFAETSSRGVSASNHEPSETGVLFSMDSPGGG